MGFTFLWSFIIWVNIKNDKEEGVSTLNASKSSESFKSQIIEQNDEASLRGEDKVVLPED